ncbi:MAG TPA: ABC transporter permease [Candidatus Paceibacterota bacterium]|nr:ABC transporter permease [Candidatus Paceibacterota bacterium]
MKRSPIVIGFYTMIRRDVLRLFRIWTQTLLPPAITMGLYFAIFGAFIGSQLAPIAGHTYIQYIVPGLIMMSVITTTYMHVVMTFYFAKWQHTLEEQLVSPMPGWVIITSFISTGIIRAFLTGVIVIAISLFFTHLSLFSVGVIFGAAFLTALLFSLLGLINGIFAKSFDDISIVPTFVLTPLTYLGGVFYSIEQLPELFRNLSLANPILYMVNAFRYGFLGVSDISLAVCFAVMGGLVLAAFGVTVWLFKTGAGFKQ